MLNWANATEANTVGVFLSYVREHHSVIYKMVFSDGESFWARYDTDYETDNEYEIDEGLETEEIDFQGVAVEPVKIERAGRRTSAGFELIQIDYRDFPVLITTESGEVVYNKPNA